MFTIHFKSNRIKNDFDSFLGSLSEDKQKEILNRIVKNPFPTPPPYGEVGTVEKKGEFYCYEITGGDRLVYEIWKREKIIFVRFVGNHDDEIEFFRKYSKKTKKR